MQLPLTDPDTLFEELLQDLPPETVQMAREFKAFVGIVSGSPIGGLHFAQPARCHPTTLNACYHIVLW
jgi:hypothetical protein